LKRSRGSTGAVQIEAEIEAVEAVEAVRGAVEAEEEQ
jgi:hypothetical protein